MMAGWGQGLKISTNVNSINIITIVNNRGQQLIVEPQTLMHLLAHYNWYGSTDLMFHEMAEKCMYM